MEILKDLKPLVRSMDGMTPAPDNVRDHPEENIEAIAFSLQTYGQVTPIVVDRKGVVRKGNGTFLAAQRIGATEIAAVTFVGKDAQGYAIADNQTGLTSKWNYAALADQLREFQANPSDYTDAFFATLFDTSELNAILAADWKPPTPPAPPASPKDKSVSFPSELWSYVEDAAKLYQSRTEEEVSMAQAVASICRDWAASISK